MPAWKKPLGKSKCIWQENIKIDIKEIVVKTKIGLIWIRIGCSDGTF
jgi:hypothetical protein